MAISLLNVVARHERRLRLVFNHAPATAAFTSTSYYSVTSTDNHGASPSVTGAIAIASNPNAVDLALGYDLAPGGEYLVAVNAMPAIDASTCSGSTLMRFGATPENQNQEVPPDDYASLLYGVDIVFDSVDFVETVDGDLATLEGLSNAQQGIRGRLFGEGLGWDPTWGASPRQYVDATPGSAPNLKASLVRQAYADDRVKKADATFYFDGADPFKATFDINITLIGGETLAPITVKLTK